MFAVNVQNVSVGPTAAELRLHHSVHLGYKQFSCGLCDKEFTRKATVKRHFKKCSAEHGVTAVVL